MEITKPTYEELITKNEEQEKRLIKLTNEGLLNENVFFEFFTNSHSVKLMMDESSGMIINANNAASSFYGYSIEELTSMNINQINTLSDSEILHELKQAASAHKTSFYFKHKLKSGEIRDVKVNAGKITLHNKEFIYSIIFDVTELTQANIAIQKNNDRLESLMRIVGYKVDSTQKLLDYTLNEAVRLCESKYGFIFLYNEEQEEFTLNTWSKGVMEECEMLNPKTVYNLKDSGRWGEAVRRREPFIINKLDYDILNPKSIPEGHVSLSNFLSIPVFVENRIVATVGVANKQADYNYEDVRQLTLLMDAIWKILENKKQQKELIKAKEKAEESNRLKDAFLNNISHEFRTPMNGIVGFTDLLIEPDNSDEDRVLFAQKVKESCDRLLDIVTDTVEMAKIHSHTMKIEKAECCLKCIILEVLHKLEPAIIEKGLELSLKLEGKDVDYLLESDEQKLRSSLKHLIDNAIKYTNSGNIEIKGHKNENNKLEITVSDTGIGISPEIQNKVFEAYAGINIHGEYKFEGSGLGLPLTKAYIEMLGGNVKLKSQENIGTVVTITIPSNIYESQCAELEDFQ